MRCDDCNSSIDADARIYCAGCVEARESTAAVSTEMRAATEMLRSARLYFPPEHPMRDGIERLLAQGEKGGGK